MFIVVGPVEVFISEINEFPKSKFVAPEPRLIVPLKTLSSTTDRSTPFGSVKNRVSPRNIGEPDLLKVGELSQRSPLNVPDPKRFKTSCPSAPSN
jgi:hypothetical protein